MYAIDIVILNSPTLCYYSGYEYGNSLIMDWKFCPKVELVQEQLWLDILFLALLLVF